MARRMWSIVGAVAGAGVVGLLFAAPASALVSVDDESRVWIYGQKLKQSSGSCFGKSYLGKPQKLQLRDGTGTWRTVASSKRYVKSALCGRQSPYTVVYSFQVSELGEPDGDGAFTLQAREVHSDGDVWPFVKTVYASRSDHAKSLLDAFTDLLGNPVG